MNRTVIDNPKDTTGIVIGWPRHDLFDQPIKRRNSVLGFAPAENSGVVDVQSAEVKPGSAALVSILDARRTTLCTAQWDGGAESWRELPCDRETAAGTLLSRSLGATGRVCW